ncbi:hypothetical protein ACVWWI_006591 [Bradyrhizobium sp. USDA 3686]|nr:hypothetical protein [Bradyrhizobium canariense]
MTTLATVIPDMEALVGNTIARILADKGRIQAVVATPIVFTHDSNSSSASAGVFQPKVFLGRALRAAATAAIMTALWTLRSVPFGKY